MISAVARVYVHDQPLHAWIICDHAHEHEKKEHARAHERTKRAWKPIVHTDTKKTSVFMYTNTTSKDEHVKNDRKQQPRRAWCWSTVAIAVTAVMVAAEVLERERERETQVLKP